MHHTISRRVVCGVPLLLGSVGLVALVAGSGGCAEHRIPVDEFLAMEPPAAPSRTTEAARLSAEDINRLMGPFTLGPGDVMEIVMATGTGPGMAPFRARVDPQGEIRLPLAGLLPVSDMTIAQAEQAIYDAYVPDYQKDATVYLEVVRPELIQVMVTGAVTSPGLIPLRRNERNVLYAIVAAGGASAHSSGEVTLERLRQPGEEPVSMHVRNPEGVKQALAMEPLEDGDIVKVHAATPNTIFVGGLVNAPVPQSYPPGTSVNVLQAITAAGGLRPDVLPREATLIRRQADGDDVYVKLNLNRITSGKDPNLTLAAGDILWVPHTWDTRVEEWVSRNVFLRAGASATYSASYTDMGGRRYGDLKGRDQTNILFGP